MPDRNPRDTIVLLILCVGNRVSVPLNQSFFSVLRPPLPRIICTFNAIKKVDTLRQK
jgi:hypothetical protein